VEMAMRAETPAAMVTIDRRARKSYRLLDRLERRCGTA